MIAISLSSKSNTPIRRYISSILSVMVMSVLAAITFGAEITVQVQLTAYQIVTINKGDSVTWVPFALSENYGLDSYTGEWKGEAIQKHAFFPRIAVHQIGKLLDPASGIDGAHYLWFDNAETYCENDS
jgi:hypothetical protein